MTRESLLRLPLAVLLITLCCQSFADEQRFARSELHMGVEFEVVLYAADSAQAEAALTKAMARIAALDKALSDYDLESELSRLSATSHAAAMPSGGFPAVKLSDDLWAVLSASQQFSRQTGGAFDVTIGPLTRLWRRARRQRELPEAEMLAAAKASSVGYKFLQLDPQAKTAQLLRPNMRLDLGGIAKGYAADEAVKTVVACGIARVLVRASGDIAAWDPPPGEAGWTVGIAPLDPDAPPDRFVSLRRMAISTSGDARQSLVVAGKRYSHILDPRTGEPVSGRSSVTVIAKSSITADALGTAISVAGPAHALDLIQKFPGAELYLVAENEERRQWPVRSAGFMNFETDKPGPSND